MTKETFHVYCRVGQRGQHFIVVMAPDKQAAKADAESRGHTVTKVRRAPTPAHAGRQGGRF